MLVQLSNVVDLDLVVEVLPDDCVCVGSSRSSCSVLSKAADCSFFLLRFLLRRLFFYQFRDTSAPRVARPTVVVRFSIYYRIFLLRSFNCCNPYKSAPLELTRNASTHHSISFEAHTHTHSHTHTFRPWNRQKFHFSDALFGTSGRSKAHNFTLRVLPDGSRTRRNKFGHARHHF